MRQFLAVLVMLCLFGSHPAGAVGFQWATAPDPDGAALQIAIWYPSNAATEDANLVAFDMSVARDAAVPAGPHPMIVMSHGTGGMALNSFDTAMALADAGFIVVAVNHTGDNYRDHSASFTRRDFVDRPRHISRVIDFMLSAWSGHASVDPARIGMFGHSAGGTTSLIVAGGIADLGQVVAFCRKNPEDWGCQHAAQRPPGAPETMTTPVSAADPRIKAVVVAAPALAAAFQPNGLAGIKVPVQLWVGEKDAVVTDASMFRALLPAPPDYHLVPGGGHFAYLTPCNAILAKTAPEICYDPAGFDRAAFLREFQEFVIAFYRQNLK